MLIGVHLTFGLDGRVSQKLTIDYVLCREVIMPPKRSINNPNPVKYQAVDLLSCPVASPAVHAEALASSDDDASDPRADIVSADGQRNQVQSDVGGAAPLRSPGNNRERFMQGFLPARTCCNLDLCRSPAGSKFNLTAICIAVFPVSVNPDRRYIQLADPTGTVGVTVWNQNVLKFSTSSVGSLVSLSRVSISSHHGKKQLTMTRDSASDIIEDPTHSVFEWWQQLLLQNPKVCGSVQDVSDNSIISVFGICGHVTSETKMVQGIPKTLTTAHLVDPSGRVDVKSWNHDQGALLQYVDKPVVFKRVRVTSFAGTKLCEILDGAGSIIDTEFSGKTSLLKFWNS